VTLAIWTRRVRTFSTVGSAVAVAAAGGGEGDFGAIAISRFDRPVSRLIFGAMSGATGLNARRKVGKVDSDRPGTNSSYGLRPTRWS
jgi:hypothetical protein